MRLMTLWAPEIIRGHMIIFVVGVVNGFVSVSVLSGSAANDSFQNSFCVHI